MMGWGERGVPAKAKLWELDLGWMQDYLPAEKYNDKSR